MDNYDLLFSDDYAYESYDSLFDDSYSYDYAMEAGEFGAGIKSLLSEDSKKLSKLVGEARKLAKDGNYSECKKKLVTAKGIVSNLISKLEKVDDNIWISLGESFIVGIAVRFLGGIVKMTFYITNAIATHSLRNVNADSSTTQTDYTKSHWENLVSELKRSPSKRQALSIYRFTLNSINESIKSCDAAMKSNKSNFLGRIAEESYNEGYQAALRDLGI